MAEVTRAQIRKGLVVPLVVASFGLLTFWESPGAEKVRVVQILALIAVGMGLGVALAHLKILLGTKKE